ncbi:MAG: VanZ family protein [Acutalibacter sp.]|nr:VanZ family protein [Acutalibacter sp.]
MTESLQLLTGFLIGQSYRSFDVDDFILNGLAAYFGIGLSKVFLEKILKRGKRRE